jgi:hypothetical protein
MACFAFFSPRFSFSDLPDFFDRCWRGDLSAMACSFRWGSLTVRVVDQLQSSGTRRDYARRRQVDTARTVRHSGLLTVRSVEASGLRRVTAPTVQPKRADSPKKCPNTTSHRGRTVRFSAFSPVEHVEAGTGVCES